MTVYSKEIIIEFFALIMNEEIRAKAEFSFIFFVNFTKII